MTTSRIVIGVPCHRDEPGIARTVQSLADSADASRTSVAHRRVHQRRRPGRRAGGRGVAGRPRPCVGAPARGRVQARGVDGAARRTRRHPRVRRRRHHGEQVGHPGAGRRARRSRAWSAPRPNKNTSATDSSPTSRASRTASTGADCSARCTRRSTEALPAEMPRRCLLDDAWLFAQLERDRTRSRQMPLAVATVQLPTAVARPVATTRPRRSRQATDAAMGPAACVTAGGGDVDVQDARGLSARASGPTSPRWPVSSSSRPAGPDSGYGEWKLATSTKR